MNLEGLDNNQRAAVQAVIPLLPMLMNQVIQRVNAPKPSKGTVSATRAGHKKVTQRAEEDPEEQKNFLMSPMFR